MIGEIVVAECAHRSLQLGTTSKNQLAVTLGDADWTNWSNLLRQVLEKDVGLNTNRNRNRKEPFHRIDKRALVTEVMTRRAGSVGSGFDSAGRKHVSTAGWVVRLNETENSDGVIRVGDRQEECARNADKRGAFQFRRIDIRGRIEVRMNVTIGPVVEIDRRNTKRAVAVNLVIASQGEWRHLSPQRLLAAFRRNQRISRRSTIGEVCRLLVYKLSEVFVDVVGVRGKTIWTTRDVKDRLS